MSLHTTTGRLLVLRRRSLEVLGLGLSHRGRAGFLLLRSVDAQGIEASPLHHAAALAVAVVKTTGDVVAVHVAASTSVATSATAVILSEHATSTAAKASSAWVLVLTPRKASPAVVSRDLIERMTFGSDLGEEELIVNRKWFPADEVVSSYELALWPWSASGVLVHGEVRA